MNDDESKTILTLFKSKQTCCFRAYAKMAATSNQYVGGGTKTVSMFSKLVSQGSSFVMEGVKNLVVKRHVSRMLICICELTVFVMQY